MGRSNKENDRSNKGEKGENSQKFKKKEAITRESNVMKRKKIETLNESTQRHREKQNRNK